MFDGLEKFFHRGQKKAALVNEGEAFLFVGNALWLDFVNTQISVEGEPVDLLKSEEDLRLWLVRSGALSAGELPDAALLPRARDLRAFLRTLAGQMAQGISVSEAPIKTLNGLLSSRRGSMQLFGRDGGWKLEFHSEDTQGVAALVLIVQSAAATLSAGDWHLVRRCEGANCVLFFYDTSKNHKRRWCSMETCGNRRKAAAHYRRVHAG